MGLSQFDEAFPYVFGTSMAASTGTGSIPISGTEATVRRIDAITCTNTDTIAHVVDLRQNIGGTNRLMGSATIPIGAGIGGLPAADILALSQPATQIATHLLPGDSLTLVLEVALNTAKTIDILTRGGLL